MNDDMAFAPADEIGVCLPSRREPVLDVSRRSGISSLFVRNRNFINRVYVNSLRKNGARTQVAWRRDARCIGGRKFRDKSGRESQIRS